MPKMILAKVFTDGLSDEARQVLRAAIDRACDDKCRTLHQLELNDFRRIAFLPIRTSRGELAQILEEASCGVLRFTGIDTDRLNEPRDLGAFRPFQTAAVTSTHVEFQVCPGLTSHGVYFDGFWSGVDLRLG